MAVTRGTLQIARRLRRDIGTEVDQVARDLTGAWIEAWDELATPWQLAAADLVAGANRLEHWPRPTDIARLDRVMGVLDASEKALAGLTERTRNDATERANRVIDADTEFEARIIASQAPTTEQEGLLRHLTGRFPVAEQDRDAVQLQVNTRIRTDAVNVMRNRAAGQITADTLPLAPDATAAMQRELIRGVDLSTNPREAAARMVAGVEGQFNGGLTRALNISRTEILDAYRATSQQIHAANSDIVPAWSWLATWDRRVCPSCISLHGTVYPASEPGPQDHQQGRCSRLPQLASWAELGITAPEPPSAIGNSQAWFDGLPEATQLQIMGPARLALYRDGRVGWGDLSTTRQNPGWRPSRVPTPVGDLRHRADSDLPPTPGPTTPPRPAAPRPRITTPTLPAPRPAALSFDDRVATATQGPDVMRAAPVGRGRGLSPDEASALEAYALNTFKPINNALRVERGPAGWIPQVYPQVTQLDAALARSALPTEALVYRGIRNGEDVFGASWGRNLTGAEWTEHGYLSTSVNPYVSAGFSGEGGGFMNILVPQGTRGLSVPGAEDELLLQRGLRLRVLNDSGPGTVPRRLDVEVIP